MGRKVNKLFQKLISDANLLGAAKNTMRNGIRFKAEGAKWKLEQEKHLLKLKKMLLDQTYKHGAYQTFTVLDPKKRSILAAHLSDRVLHHAIYDVLTPLIDKKFIYHSYACRKNKGQHKAIDQAQKWCRDSRYFMHLDIKKFFASIDREVLKKIISKTVKDIAVRSLLFEVIDSSTKHGFFCTNLQMQLFDVETKSDDYPTSKSGIPIGNLTSQLFANWYLDTLDQYVKHQLKIKKYIRYMDDFVLFTDSKQALIQAEQHIKLFCRNVLKLEVHDSGGPTCTSRGLTFLGFRIFKYHIRVKTASLQRFRTKFKDLCTAFEAADQPDVFDFYQRIQSWNAHAAKAYSYRLRCQIFEVHALSNNFWELKMDYKAYLKQQAHGSTNVA